MIRTLQRRFTITAMAAVTVLLLLLLGTLNVVNAVINARQASRILEDLSSQQLMPYIRENREPSKDDGRPFGDLEIPDIASPEDPIPNDAFHADPNAEFSPPGAFNPGDFGPEDFASGEFRNRRRATNFFFQDQGPEDLRLSSLYFTVLQTKEREILSVDVSHIASISEEDAITLTADIPSSSGSGRHSGFLYQTSETPDGRLLTVFLDNSARSASVLRVLLLSALMGLVSWLLMLILVLALSRRAIRPIAENMERQRRFVTDAGHELKTPLSIILANVDALELRGGETKYSRNIRTQAKRLSDLMKNLLTLARWDEASTLEKPEPLDFSTLCEEAFSMFREPAELRSLRFSLDIHPELSVEGDRSLLSQLCSILGDNAVKYCSDGGEIRVTLEPDAKSCVLNVENSVAEMPDITSLFDRFYRSDSSRNQKSGGFGIGLSAAESVARLHKGSIIAAGDESGKTLHFQVRLPRFETNSSLPSC